MTENSESSISKYDLQLVVWEHIPVATKALMHKIAVIYHCIYRNTPAISPTDPPEQEAIPQHQGTPAVLLLHMADGWFQNLEKQHKYYDDNWSTQSRKNITGKYFFNCYGLPDPFLPLSIKEQPSFPGYKLTTRHETDS